MITLRKILAVSFFLFQFAVFSVADNLTGMDLAQQVLDDLYDVSGQYIYEKPALELSPENGRVAAYSPSKNLITIDPKALKICESLGDQSINALAFLIGHELVHAFQKEVRDHNETTHFLSYDKHIHSSVRTEKVADIQGVFTGYLAGYGMLKAIPVVLDKLYDAYDLKGKTLPNYPSYEEREGSAKEVIGMVEDLIDLFEVNQYLLALGEHNLASSTLEYILEYYQGYDIQNNLGVTYLFQAFEFYDPNIDKFLFPIKMESSSSLEKINLSRGPLNHYERKSRNLILNSALAYLNRSIELNPDYTLAKINKASALIMLQKPEEAISFLGSRTFNAKERSNPDYSLIYGIAEALTNQEFQAVTRFQKLAKHQNPATCAYADFNLNVLKDIEHYGYLKKEVLSIPSAVYKLLDELSLGSTRDGHAINLKEGLVCKIKNTDVKRSCSFGDGFSNIFSITTAEKQEKISLFSESFDLSAIFHQNLVVIKNHLFVDFENEKAIVKCDFNGKVIEIGRYH